MSGTQTAASMWRALSKAQLVNSVAIPISQMEKLRTRARK